MKYKKCYTKNFESFYFIPDWLELSEKPFHAIVFIGHFPERCIITV
jgi:hypothetical protein